MAQAQYSRSAHRPSYRWLCVLLERFMPAAMRDIIFAVRAEILTLAFPWRRAMGFA